MYVKCVKKKMTGEYSGDVERKAIGDCGIREEIIQEEQEKGGNDI